MSCPLLDTLLIEPGEQGFLAVANDHEKRETVHLDFTFVAGAELRKRF